MMSQVNDLPTSSEVFDELSRHFGAGVDDPYPMLAERRRRTPVMEGDIMLELGGVSFVGLHDGPAFTLLRRDDIVAALRDQETYSSSIWKEVQGPLTGENMLAMADPQHRMMRGLITPVFSPRALAGWDEEVLQPLAKRLVEELAVENGLNLVEFAFRFPIRAIYELIGLTDDDSDDEWASLAMRMLLALAFDPAQAEQGQKNRATAMQASQAILERLVAVVEGKRADGAKKNDLISHLINVEFEGRKLDDREIAKFLRSIFMPATETTTRQFLNTAACLLTRPDVLDAVRSDRTRVDGAMLEGERLEPTTLAIPRVATRDVELRGVTVPEGAAVLMALGSANRDEEAYLEPDEFIVGRDGPPPLSFGFGPHICVGKGTARLEIRARINAMLNLPGVRLDPDAEPPTVRGVNLRAPSSLQVVWG